jgi:hypothetical protein
MEQGRSCRAFLHRPCHLGVSLWRGNCWRGELDMLICEWDTVLCRPPEGHDGHFVYIFVICTQRRQPNFELVYLHARRTVSISAFRGWSQGGLEKMDGVSNDTQSLPCSADVAIVRAGHIALIN